MATWLVCPQPKGLMNGWRERINLDLEPCRTVKQAGIGGGSYHLENDDVPTIPTDDRPSKPPYRVPSMAEVASVPWNGLKVASTFSGCGGSSLGYRMAGFKVVWASEFVKAARDCYLANCDPDTVMDDRDIRDVTEDDFFAATGMTQGELDLLDGSPPCFAAGTPVTTIRGIIPIEEVVAGDQVLTHKCRWRKVIGTSSKEATTILIDNRIEVTADHLFYAKRQQRKWEFSAKERGPWHLGEAGWIPAEQIRKQFCGTPADVERCDIPLPPKGFSYDGAFWYAVGRWVGDGWLRIDPGEQDGAVGHGKDQHRTPVPCKSCRKPSVRNARYPNCYTSYCSAKCRNQFKRKHRRRLRNTTLICTGLADGPILKEHLSHLGVAIGEQKQRATVRFTISKKSLTYWLLRWFRRGSRNKTLPGWCLGMPREWRVSLLWGYLEADGCRPDSGGYKCATVSRCLEAAINQLAVSLGKTTCVMTRKRQKETSMICGRVVNVAEVKYGIQIHDDDSRYTRLQNGIRWRKIRREIKPGKQMTRVYDIEVEEDHSFVADGFIVHNCASFSTAGKRQAGWGIVKSYSDNKQRTDDLFFYFIRLLRGIRPRTFVAENVSGLIKGTAKGYFLLVLKLLKESGYRVACRVLDAQWLGVPQMRQRTIFVGVREDLVDDGGKPIMPAHPSPLPWRYSVREAIPWLDGTYHRQNFAEEGFRDGDKPAPTDRGSQGGSQHFQGVPSVGEQTFGEARSYDGKPGPSVRAKKAGHIIVSDSRNRSDDFVIKAPPVEPESSMSGYATGRAHDEMACPSEAGHQQSERYFQLIKPATGEPCPTITAEGGNPGIASVCHPTERRKFSIAELRRICSFPDDFVLLGSYAAQWERLGRAVPPVMMAFCAAIVRDQILRKADGLRSWEYDLPFIKEAKRYAEDPP